MIPRYVNALFDGSKAAARRNWLGKTQGQIAKAIGTSESMVSFWETGRTTPRAGWMPPLAEALDCSPVDLLTRSPESLREWRYAAGFTATELASVVGLKRDTLLRVEAGSNLPRDRTTIPPWAEALGLTVEEWLAAFKAGET